MNQRKEASLTHLLSPVGLFLQFVSLRPYGCHTKFADLGLKLIELLELVILMLQCSDGLLFGFQSITDAACSFGHIGDIIGKTGVGSIHALELGGLGEEAVLVLGLAAKEFLGLLLIQDGDGIFDLNVELVEHGIQILLVAALLHAIFVEELVAVVPAAEGDGPLDGDGIAVDVVLVSVVAAVEDGDADLGTVAVRSSLLADQLLEVGGAVRAAGTGTEADLDGGQDGGLWVINNG